MSLLILSSHDLISLFSWSSLISELNSRLRIFLLNVITHRIQIRSKLNTLQISNESLIWQNCNQLNWRDLKVEKILVNLQSRRINSFNSGSHEIFKRSTNRSRFSSILKKAWRFVMGTSRAPMAKRIFVWRVQPEATLSRNPYEPTNDDEAAS